MCTAVILLAWYVAAWWMMRDIRRRARLLPDGLFWWWLLSPFWLGPIVLPVFWVLALRDSGVFGNLSEWMFK